MQRNGLLALAGMCLLFASNAVYAQTSVKIGVLNDQSGVYADTSGLGSVNAAQIAVDEFRAKRPDIKVEIVSADHQNKPDTATAIARRWYDAENVDAIVDLQNSAVALAVQLLARQSKKISIVTGAVTPVLSGKECSATGVVWSMDAYSLVTGPVRALADKKKWFFMTVDLAGGHLFEAEGVAAVNANGGTVVGHARHPLNSPDMSSFLLQAQSAGPDVITLANAGNDAINSIKGAKEFGLFDRGISVAPLLFFETDIKSVGLDLTQGMVMGTGFYWDLNDRTRAFAKQFGERFKQRMPTQYQASVYAATKHYLAAVVCRGHDRKRRSDGEGAGDAGGLFLQPSREHPPRWPCHL
jgi:branched-chain amino acid transport system substrate-binding protein